MFTAQAGRNLNMRNKLRRTHEPTIGKRMASECDIASSGNSGFTLRQLPAYTASAAVMTTLTLAGIGTKWESNVRAIRERCAPTAGLLLARSSALLLGDPDCAINAVVYTLATLT